MSEENSVRVEGKELLSDELKNAKLTFMSKYSEKSKNADLVQSELDKIDLSDPKYRKLLEKVQLQNMKDNLKYLYENFDLYARLSHTDHKDYGGPLAKVTISSNPGNFEYSYGLETVGGLSKILKFDVYKLLQEGENLV